MSDSFVYEFLIKTDFKDENILKKRLKIAGILYNTLLKEGFRRIKLLKQSKKYQLAIKTSKGKDRQKLFIESRKENNFSDYEFQKFAIKTKNSCFIKDHLGAHICQKLATKAYLVLNKFLINKGGKPRYKKLIQYSTVEGKSNKTAIRWKNKKAHWKGLELDVIFDKKDKYGIQKHALLSKVKYCRIYKKNIKNKVKWFLQLILKGKPLIKEKNISIKKGSVGIDLGPSTIAVVGENDSFLEPFCKELDQLHLKKKKVHKKISRKLRLNNPDNFDEKNAVKKGAKNWLKSNRMKKDQQEINEVFRKLKESRKRSHNKLANRILKFGNQIKTEKLSFRVFQKLFGRSVSFRGPSSFLSKLKYKAENAGIKFDEFSTYKTYLSQICHNCLKKEKKPLSQRWHKCICNINPTQRDLYTAYLSRFVENNTLNIGQAKKNWPGAHPLLEQAMLRLKQIASGKNYFASFGLNEKLNQRQSDSLAKDRSNLNETKNVVRRNSESFGKFRYIAVRTP